MLQVCFYKYYIYYQKWQVLLKIGRKNKYKTKSLYTKDESASRKSTGGSNMLKPESKESKKQWEKIKNLIRNEKFSDTMKLWEMVTYLPIEPGTLTRANKARLATEGWRVHLTEDEDYIIVPSIITEDILDECSKVGFRKETEESKIQWKKIVEVIQENDVDKMPVWTMITYLPVKAGTLTAQNRTRIISAGWKIFETPAEDYFLIPAVLETFGLHDDARCFII